MKHLADDELVLHFYGEEPRAGAHIGGCAECRARFEALSRTLAAIRAPQAPERSAAYGGEVWNRIRAHLPQATPPRPWWQAARRWVPVAAIAALVLLAFFIGRHFPSVSIEQVKAPAPPQVRDRVLLVALDDHLERSQMLLVELTHATDPNDPLLAADRERAGDLAAANRLYRQSAQKLGDPGTVAVLDELERVLLDVAHQHAQLTDTQLQELRGRIESQGLLFKVRVIQDNVQSEVGPAAHTKSKPQPRHGI